MLRKEQINDNMYDYHVISGCGSERVDVRPHQKQSKELSCLYREQDISAHEGSILAMKFSLDGRYLASGGEDGIAHIWKVTVNERSTEFDAFDFDPTCLRFSVNDSFNLAPLNEIKEKGDMMKKSEKSSDSTCIIVPRKAFRILEEPLHELYGHDGEVLDLSWSEKGHLLSSLVDKTVRLWQVGQSTCLKVFPHHNYVTCTQFNPVDENFFINGSIDGKVRIWNILGHHVVDWIDIKEIVTAICYRPDGKGGIVGSMDGNCCFFEIVDSYSQLESVICIQHKKKVACKRITGFPFSPCDPNKVIVTSADAEVQILSGEDVICKFRGSLPILGLKHRGQSPASFTSEGRHIISASEDANVYIWNYSNKKIPRCRPQCIWSRESFSSNNASIAVSWHGIRSTDEEAQKSSTEAQHGGLNPYQLDKILDHKGPFLSSHSLSLSHRHPKESSVNGSATWPEDTLQKLTPTVVLPALSKIDYEFLDNVRQSIVNKSHLWGLVIVTGGWDGQIRTYHNYGLPVNKQRIRSLGSSFSCLAFRKHLNRRL